MARRRYDRLDIMVDGLLDFADRAETIADMFDQQDSDPSVPLSFKSETMSLLTDKQRKQLRELNKKIIQAQGLLTSAVAEAERLSTELLGNERMA